MHVRCLLALLATSNQEFFVLHVQLQARRTMRAVLNLATKPLQLGRFHFHMLRQRCHEQMPESTKLGRPWAGSRQRHGELLDLPGDAKTLKVHRSPSKQWSVSSTAQNKASGLALLASSPHAPIARLALVVRFAKSCSPVHSSFNAASDHCVENE